MISSVPIRQFGCSKNLYLKSSYDPENPSDWKNHLAGEPVKVRKTNFEIPDESEGLPSTAASYAYWVGDEGVKSESQSCEC